MRAWVRGVLRAVVPCVGCVALHCGSTTPSLGSRYCCRPVWWAGEKKRRGIRREGGKWRLGMEGCHCGSERRRNLHFEEQRATPVQMSGPGEVEARQVLYMVAISARGGRRLLYDVLERRMIDGRAQVDALMVDGCARVIVMRKM